MGPWRDAHSQDERADAAMPFSWTSSSKKNSPISHPATVKCSLKTMGLGKDRQLRNFYNSDSDAQCHRKQDSLQSLSLR